MACARCRVSGADSRAPLPIAFQGHDMSADPVIDRVQVPEATEQAEAPPQPAPSRPTDERHDGQVGARRRSVMSLLLVASLALALGGQLYFANFRQYLLDGVALYGLGMALFLIVVRAQESPRQVGAAGLLSGAWRTLARHPWRALMVIGSLALS